MLKKILIGLGVVFGLLVTAMVIVPMVFDANKYRPDIEKAVEDNLNADLDLGKLHLSLWGGVFIEIEKLVLSEKGSKGAHPVFAFNNAKLELPLLSVFSGRPDVTLVVKQPDIQIISGLDGKLNVMKLMKAKTPEQIAAEQQKQAQQGKASGAGAAGAAPFALSFRIEDGRLKYADLLKKTQTEIKGFDFELNKFAVNKAFTFSFKSNLDVKEMKELVLRGPFQIKGEAGVFVKPSGLDHVAFATDVDMSGLVIRYGSIFDKDAAVPLKIGVKLATTEKSLKIDRGHLQINDAAVDLTGMVDNFAAPVLNLTVSSTKLAFEHWQRVLAPLKEFDMQGSAQLNIKVVGPLAKLAINGQAKAEGISLKAPGIVPRVTDVRSTINFTSDTANISQTSLKMGASDLSLDGSLKNFAKPVIVVKVKSNLLDVDAILPQKSPEQVKAEEEAAKAAAASGKPAPEVDVEKTAAGPIAALKKNPTARGLDFTAQAQMAKLRVHKAEITNMNVEVTFKDLVMTLKKATANAFGGSMSFNSSIDFRGQDPVYTATGDVGGLDVNAAVTSQMPSLKDTIMGKLTSKFNVAGSGLSKPKVKNSLKGAGHFNLDKGAWSSLKAAKEIGEKMKSIPQAKDALGNVNITDRFRQLRSDFNISGGRFNIVNMIADMEGANTTISGNGYADFDMNLSMIGKLVAPAGDVPKDLRTSDGRMSVPLEIACTLTSPCLKWEKTASVVATAYAKKAGGDALKKAVEKMDVPPAAKELLKKLPF